MHINFRGVGMAMGMCLPAGPHGMMVSMLGLLLVFRTNSAYQRFAVSFCFVFLFFVCVCIYVSYVYVCVSILW